MSGSFEATSDGATIVLVDVSEDRDSLAEGLAREAVNRIQKLRKKAGLMPGDAVAIAADAPAGSDLAAALATHLDTIKTGVKQPVALGGGDEGGPVLVRETTVSATLEANGGRLAIGIDGLTGCEGDAADASHLLPAREVGRCPLLPAACLPGELLHHISGPDHSIWQSS